MLNLIGIVLKNKSKKKKRISLTYCVFTSFIIFMYLSNVGGTYYILAKL